MSVTSYLVIAYLVSLAVALVSITFSVRQDLKTRQITIFTLKDFTIAVFVIVIPLVNTGVGLFVLYALYQEHANNIILFRASDDV